MHNDQPTLKDVVRWEEKPHPILWVLLRGGVEWVTQSGSPICGTNATFVRF